MPFGKAAEFEQFQMLNEFESISGRTLKSSAERQAEMSCETSCFIIGSLKRAGSIMGIVACIGTKADLFQLSVCFFTLHKCSKCSCEFAL